MTAETTGSAVGVVTALPRVSLDGPEEFWAMSLGLFDAIIRTFYGVYEFTDDRVCSAGRAESGALRCRCLTARGSKPANWSVVAFSRRHSADRAGEDGTE